MRMHRMCIDAMDAVDALESDYKALASAGWKPANVGHLQRSCTYWRVTLPSNGECCARVIIALPLLEPSMAARIARTAARSSSSPPSLNDSLRPQALSDHRRVWWLFGLQMALGGMARPMGPP
jgi:hypothetical protein